MPRRLRTDRKRAPSKGCSRLSAKACQAEAERCEYQKSTTKGVRSKCVTRRAAPEEIQEADGAFQKAVKAAMDARAARPKTAGPDKPACYKLKLAECRTMPGCSWSSHKEGGRKWCRPSAGEPGEDIEAKDVWRDVHARRKATREARKAAGPVEAALAHGVVAEEVPAPAPRPKRVRPAPDLATAAGKRAARKEATMTAAREIAKKLGEKSVACRKHLKRIPCEASMGCAWRSVANAAGRQSKPRCVPDLSLLDEERQKELSALMFPEVEASDAD